MTKRVLVTYATRAGSTTAVAAAIGETLTARGFIVDIEPVKDWLSVIDRPRLVVYDAVLIGSAIRMGGWLPEAIDFIKNHQEMLRKLPVALFTVHMLNLGDDETSRSAREAYLTAVRPLVTPIQTVFFAGAIDPKRLSVIDRMITSVVQKQANVETGDYRDWEKIRGWAYSFLPDGA